MGEVLPSSRTYPCVGFNSSESGSKKCPIPAVVCVRGPALGVSVLVVSDRPTAARRLAPPQTRVVLPRSEHRPLQSEFSRWRRSQCWRDRYRDKDVVNGRRRETSGTTRGCFVVQECGAERTECVCTCVLVGRPAMAVCDRTKRNRDDRARCLWPVDGVTSCCRLAMWLFVCVLCLLDGAAAINVPTPAGE